MHQPVLVDGEEDDRGVHGGGGEVEGILAQGGIHVHRDAGQHDHDADGDQAEGAYCEAVVAFLHLAEQEQDDQDQVEVGERVGHRRARSQGVHEDAVVEARGGDDHADEIQVEQHAVDEVAGVEEEPVPALFGARQVDHRAEDGNGAAEHADKHQAVPEQRRQDARVRVHHEGTETPEGHEGHVGDEIRVDLFLAAVQAEDDEGYVDAERECRHQRRQVKNHQRLLEFWS